MAPQLRHAKRRRCHIHPTQAVGPVCLFAMAGFGAFLASRMSEDGPDYLYGVTGPLPPHRRPGQRARVGTSRLGRRATLRRRRDRRGSGRAGGGGGVRPPRRYHAHARHVLDRGDLVPTGLWGGRGRLAEHPALHRGHRGRARRHGDEASTSCRIRPPTIPAISKPLPQPAARFRTASVIFCSSPV